MKKALYLSAMLTLGFSATAAMPDASLMASGKWTKMQVMADGIYQLTYDQLAEMGYHDPAAVKVYGYSPTLLLSHSSSVIPGDMSPVHTLNVPEQKKIIFYLSDNYDCSPEIWRTNPSAKYVIDHLRHVNANGATYFLSDADSGEETISTIQAPTDIDSTSTLTSHQAVIVHEKDDVLISEGGTWYVEDAPINPGGSLSHEFTVDHIASGNAMLYYSTLTASTLMITSNYVYTSFSDGIKAESSLGHSPAIISGKNVYEVSLRSQHLTLPQTTEAQTHTVSFYLPQSASMSKPCALDFFAIMYDRTNDVGVRPQTHMYFKNWSASNSTFELTGISGNDWKVWNVTNPLAIKNVELANANDKFYGSLPSTTSYHPNEVIAFNTAAEHPAPEILGAVANQNLHAIEVPDMLIVTSTPLLTSAQKIAELHNRLQGLNVAVCDQMQIFNEFGSGNVSPEAVRRFVTHLSARAPGKLKGVLLLGPGTPHNRDRVNEESPYVITAECEDYTQAKILTTSYCADLFFVTTGEPYSGNNLWAERQAMLQVFKNPITIGIGRLPFSAASEINDYYKKVETYLTDLPTYPSIGNALFASDLSTANDKQRTHLSDAEGMIAAFDQANVGKTLTVTRCASNIYSKTNNNLLKKVHNQALARGVQFYAFFGHGSATQISGTTTVTDYLFDLTLAHQSSYPGKAPFMFIASCHVAAFDLYDKTLAGALTANPHGGALTVISACREVYPEHNQNLGIEYARIFENSTDRTPIGQIWSSAASSFISKNYDKKSGIANTLDYNMIGDPMLPVYRSTHRIVVNPIVDNLMSITSPSTISGYVTDLNGNIDTDFNGNVVLTFYDPVRTYNTVGDCSIELSSVETDQEVIGQTIARVSNGRFSVSTKAPTTTAGGTHRIQAYAVSNDATERGLGYIDGIAFTSAGIENPSEAEPISISAMTAEVSDAAANHKFKAHISATISAPAGLAHATSVISPLRLRIDDAAITNAGRLIRLTGDGTYALDFTTDQLGFGNHSATLAALDANGNWAEQSINFMVDNTPSAKISAAVADGEVNFELLTDVAQSTNRLVVEHLNGDVELDQTFSGSSLTTNLEPGVYRAFIQVRSKSAAAATPKIQFVVD